jgi:hypothetical protein
MNEREEKCDERTRSSSAIVGSLVVKSLSACDKSWLIISQDQDK